MVRLSLHGFVVPRVHEYGTLTSEDRWNEYADVVLANPPFMPPKDCIRPHSRFSIKSKRSEVLFVDYMAAPASSCLKALFSKVKMLINNCEMLVEEYFVAEISLPAGVFNPYSGVKHRF